MVEQALIVDIKRRRFEALRHRHTNRSRQSLSQRACRGFDTGDHTVFGVTGRTRGPRAITLDVLDRHRRLPDRPGLWIDRLHTGQMQHPVQEVAGVADREDEPISVFPFWIVGIVAEVFGIDGVDRRRQGHSSARIARTGLFYSIDGERSQRRDRKRVEIPGFGVVHVNPIPA